MSQTGQAIYHDTTMVEAQLRNERNRSRARLACHREQAPVKHLSMNTYATAVISDFGRTESQPRHVGDVVSGWLA